MKATCPRLVIAGTGSGVGKTSLALGLARWLARQGLRVQTFKVGPDFLDPSYLALASGRTCYNLDGWMTSRDYVRGLFARTTADADLALIEGVMGMFDGASPQTLAGSTAEIAQWLGAPVLLVANAHGVARSLAATVKGFAQFEPGVHVAGVIANQGGSPRHRSWLAESLASAGTAPLLGMLPRGSLPTLPSRHLGLVAADQANFPAESLDRLADACGQHLDVPAIMELARAAENLEVQEPSSPGSLPAASVSRRVRLGIARDEAFHFYYADNLESLAGAGAEWAPFSPLADRRLPADLDGLYFGGGAEPGEFTRLARFRRRLSRGARGPAGRQRGNAHRRSAVCGLGPRHLCRVWRADVPGPNADVPGRHALSDGWRVAHPDGHVGKAQGAWLRRGHVGGRLPVGRGRTEGAGPRVPLLRNHFGRVRLGRLAAGLLGLPCRRRARAWRFFPRSRLGRLRAFALGLSAGCDRSFPQ